MTPSPVIATVCPLRWSASIICLFWAGVTRPNTLFASITSSRCSGSSGSERASKPSVISRPTLRAMAATVRGSSPEMIFNPTPSARKKLRVSRASERGCSRKVRSATGRSDTGSCSSFPSPCGLSPRARTSVRRPVSAKSPARRKTSCRLGSSGWRGTAPPGVETGGGGCGAVSSPWIRTISGAPRIHVCAARPRPSKLTPLHFRAEENGTAETGWRPPSSSKAVLRQRAVAFASGSAPNHARTCSQPGAGANGCTASKTSPPSVRVPVLSMQRTSTRASPSTAASSWIRTLWPANRSPPTAKATLVNRTSPNGTMAIMLAMRPTRTGVQSPVEKAACQPPRAWTSPLTTRIATGSRAQAIQRSTRLRLFRISEFTSEKRRASTVSRLANDAAPTRTTWALPWPATTIDPESTSVRSSLSTGSASPVRRDSSTSSPDDSSTVASAVT